MFEQATHLPGMARAMEKRRIITEDLQFSRMQKVIKEHSKEITETVRKFEAATQRNLIWRMANGR